MAPIFVVCRASTAVTDLLGTNPTRLYPFGQAPQNVAKPYAVWQVIGGS
ncbi:MAG: tail completion protein gp17, partial [Shewanella sp.]